MPDKFIGEVICRSYQEKIDFEAAALKHGYSVSTMPLKDRCFKLTFFVIDEEDKQLSPYI